MESYKRPGLLWLASFLQHNVFKCHPHCRTYQYAMLLYCSILSHCTDISYFVYTFTIDAHLGCFHLWVALLGTFTHKFLCGRMCSLLLSTFPGAQLLGPTATPHLTLWRNIFQSIFHSSGTILQSHQQWGGFQNSLHPLQHLPSPLLSIIVILVDVK